MLAATVLQAATRCKLARRQPPRFAEQASRQTEVEAKAYQVYPPKPSTIAWHMLLLAAHLHASHSHHTLLKQHPFKSQKHKSVLSLKYIGAGLVLVATSLLLGAGLVSVMSADVVLERDELASFSPECNALIACWSAMWQERVRIGKPSMVSNAVDFPSIVSKLDEFTSDSRIAIPSVEVRV